MKKPKALILSGYGLNCEEETQFAFQSAGADAYIVHVNDIGSRLLRGYQILAFPGGFSYGDDTGSGKAYANKLKNHLWHELREFVERDTLVFGACNGFQILTNLGLLPGALTVNNSARYIDRWVDLKIEGKSPWLLGIETLSLPIAHGEGKFYINTQGLRVLQKHDRIAATYTRGEICGYQNLPPNPNGALKDIAGILGANGRIFGLMPHPERAMFFTQLPHWQYLKDQYERAGRAIPTRGPGLQVFENAVRYFAS